MAKRVTAEGPVEGRWSLPTGWRWRRARDLGKIVGGSTPKNASDPTNFTEDGIPWLTPADLSGYTGRTIGVGRRNLAPHVVNRAALLPTGSVLISSRAPVGYCAVTSNPMVTNQGFRSLIPADDVDPFFIRYYVLFSREYLEDHASGTTFKELSGSALGDLVFPVPPIDVQRRIVARIDELFAEVDDGEAALARARDDLATWRKALLKAAVTGELTADWRAANPATETGAELLARILADRRSWWAAESKNKGKRYKEPLATDGDALAAIPAGWTWATAEQIVRKAEYGTSIKCHETPSGPPVLRMGNIQDGGLDWRKLKYAPAGAPLPLLKAGDVLFNRTNSAELLGKSAVFDGLDSPVSFASYIVAVRLAGMLPHFFSAWMNSIYGRQWIAQNKSQQVGQANLSAGTLMRMEIPVPPIAEQQRIVELITADRTRDDALGSDLNDLAQAGSTLRQSILAAAFRGDLA